MAERQFGPYRLVKQIAVGGMAEIHLAKTRGIAGFEKFCALKMIHPNFAQDEQFIEMLIDEAKIAVQLQHVNIAQTFDLGRVGDTYYITMEFVDGADLYKVLRRGSEQDLDMPLDVAAFVAKEMATGLDYAHRKKDGSGNTLGIVHRDVSPQNVLLSNAGEVKLVDFGIAKATMKARQTAVGVIKGKYYYMSPEQAWGERLDYRSDIFSAGIVLYEMLTGQMLYLEEDIHRLLDMVRRANIEPVRNLRRDVPPQLERIVMHALAKKADDRYQSAGDLSADLERFLHTYSPVFTASKLAQHLRRVLGEAGPVAASSAAPAPRDPLQSTKSISQQTFITDRSEISDENSVIFRVRDLERDAPGRARRPDQPRMISAATMEITDADLDADVEHTLVTGGPPGALGPSEDTTALEGPRGVRRSAGVAEAADDLSGLGDYEPTVIDPPPTLMPSGQHEEDQPTITRGPGVPRLAHDERPTARGRRGGPQPAALSAHTPTPAVSEVRRPRESRRTPAGGVPSVLQSLVGRPSAPMPRPARGAGAPLSDGVPAAVRESAPTHVETAPVAGRGGVPRAKSAALDGLAAGPLDPQFDAPTSPAIEANPTPRPNQVPVVPGAVPAADMANLPAHLTPYAMPPAAQTVSPYPPNAVPTPYPFSAHPGGPPMSFTKQMQAATEIDELPAHYRLPSNRGWMVRAFLALLVVTAGIVAAVAIVRSGEEAEIEASILIESTPPGAEVSIDGAALAEKTPTRFATLPGARHDIALTMPGHRPFHDAVLIPDQGGQLRVFAFLPEVTVKLRVVTTPAGADVYLGGQLKGHTPIELSDLAPDTARELEVRHKDYPPISRTLVWAEGQLEQEVVIKLRK